MQQLLLMRDLSMLVTRELSGRQTTALAREEEEGGSASVPRWLPRPYRGHRGPIQGQYSRQTHAHDLEEKLRGCHPEREPITPTHSLVEDQCAESTLSS